MDQALPPPRTSPHLQRTDSAKCSESIERSHMSKRGRGKLFLSVKVQNLYSTVVVDVGQAGSVDCVVQVPEVRPVFDSSASVLN